MSLTAFILIVGVGLPVGLLLSFGLAIKYGERVQKAWMHWVWILFGLLQIPAIFRGFDSGTSRLGFWLAVTMFFMAVAMAIYSFRETKKQRRVDQGNPAGRIAADDAG